MLVSLLSSAKDTMASAGDMQRGFQVNANSLNGEINSTIQGLISAKLNPSEKDVLDSAFQAGNMSTAKDLFSQYLNYRAESISSVASMQTSLHNFYGRVASTSAQVAQSQDRMLQTFAKSAFQIGQSAEYTKGVASAYANGLQAASGIF